MTATAFLATLLWSLLLLTKDATAFTTRARSSSITLRRHYDPPTPALHMGYIPPEASSDDSTTGGKSSSATASQKRQPVTPKVGDIVRYYDLDGGNRRGEELVGKITFLTKTSSSYLAELTQLEDLGDGYFAEYSSTKRMSKKTDRDITQVSPLRASFVRSEQAYKVPFDVSKGRVTVRQEQYDLDEWQGPASSASEINIAIVEADGLNYAKLKLDLLKNAAIAGLLGTFLANILKGTEDAVIYFAGAVASLLYLYFLSIKTDTLASPDRKMGSNVSNLRFIMPVLVVVGVALYNQSLGDANPVQSTNPFDQITTEQFGSAILGFLTYRLPLFLSQIQEGLKSSSGGAGEAILPGSAGVAMQLAKAAAAEESAASAAAESSLASALIPVLLVSGPQATGRDELVELLLKQDDRLVSPRLVDRLKDGVTFDRLENRQEFLEYQDNDRFGLTKDGILKAAAAASNDGEQESSQKVVVVNASVNLAKKLQASLSGARLIGVWVGLDSVAEFEKRIGDQIDQGLIAVEEGETRETVIRARIKEIIQEIDYGLSSGIFEFTILNKDPATSLKELKEAANYCFK